MAASPTTQRPGAGVITPDAVALDLDVATVGSRGIAYLIDLLLFLFVFAVLSLIQFALLGGGWVDSGLGVAVALLLVFAWQFGYPIGFETLWNGRTLGKAALGLRVVTVEGAPVGLRHATIRAVTVPFELLLTTGLLAAVTSFVTARGQRLGDLAAGTVVVRERRIGEAPRAERFAAPAGSASYVGQVDLSNVDAPLYGLIRDTLRRAPELPAAEAETLLSATAELVATRVRPLPPAGTTAEAFLNAIAAAVQTRRGGAGAASSAPPQPTHTPPTPPAPTSPAPTSTGAATPPPAPATPAAQDGDADGRSGAGGFITPG